MVHRGFLVVISVSVGFGKTITSLFSDRQWTDSGGPFFVVYDWTWSLIVVMSTRNQQLCFRKDVFLLESHMSATGWAVDILKFGMCNIVICKINGMLMFRPIVSFLIPMINLCVYFVDMISLS